MLGRSRTYLSKLWLRRRSTSTDGKIDVIMYGEPRVGRTMGWAQAMEEAARAVGEAMTFGTSTREVEERFRASSARSLERRAKERAKRRRRLALYVGIDFVLFVIVVIVYLEVVR